MNKPELMEINLKDTLVPGTDITDGKFISDKDEWIEAVWLGSGGEGEEVILLDSPFKGRRTLTWGYRDSIYTILHRLVDQAKELKDYIERYQERLQNETTVPVFNTIMVLNRLIYSTVKKGERNV